MATDNATGSFDPFRTAVPPCNLPCCNPLIAVDYRIPGDHTYREPAAVPQRMPWAVPLNPIPQYDPLILVKLDRIIELLERIERDTPRLV